MKKKADTETYVTAYPGIPTIDGIPAVVDYCDRSPTAFVISGPLGPPGRGDVGPNTKGRRFGTPEEALRWAEDYYPPGTRLERVRPTIRFQQGEDEPVAPRWAILVTFTTGPR